MKKQIAKTISILSLFVMLSAGGGNFSAFAGGCRTCKPLVQYAASAPAQGPSGQNGSRQATGEKGGPGQAQGGGGKPGEKGPPPTPNTEAPLEGDKANLDYARKATEMALEHLRDQKQEPDPKLLKDLGWTKEELQEFVHCGGGGSGLSTVGGLT